MAFSVRLICIGDENLKAKLGNDRYIIKSVIDVDRQEIFKVYDRFQSKSKKEEPNSQKENEMEIEPEENKEIHQEEGSPLKKKEKAQENEQNAPKNEKYEVDVRIFLKN